MDYLTLEGMKKKTKFFFKTKKMKLCPKDTDFKVKYVEKKNCYIRNHHRIEIIFKTRILEN